MPYATPSAFIQRFGLDETVQLLADEQQLLTSQLLLDAIAVEAGGAWTGDPTADEIAAAQSALARLEAQLQSSSNFMDGYLRAAVTLPLATDDANTGTLADCCLALSRVGLADDTDNATDRMDKTADGWRAWLKDVAARRVQLIGATGDAPPPASGMRSGKADSHYDWHRFDHPRSNRGLR